jgi:hypothetical protein
MRLSYFLHNPHHLTDSLGLYIFWQYSANLACQLAGDHKSWLLWFMAHFACVYMEANSITDDDVFCFKRMPFSLKEIPAGTPIM